MATTLAPASNFTRTLVLPYPPSVNHTYKLVRGRKILAPAVASYRNTIATAALSARMRLPFGLEPVGAMVDLYPARSATDLDNALKNLLDGLKGVVWQDDEARYLRQLILDFPDLTDTHGPDGPNDVRGRVEVTVYRYGWEEREAATPPTPEQRVARALAIGRAVLDRKADR